MYWFSSKALDHPYVRVCRVLISKAINPRVD